MGLQSRGNPRVKGGDNLPLPFMSMPSTHRTKVYAKRQTFDTLADDLHTNYAIGEASLELLTKIYASRAARYALKRASSVGFKSSFLPGLTVRWSVTSDSDRPYWRMIGIK